MKAKWIVRGLVILATLSALSTVIAYRLGYRKGGADERGCWILDLAPAEAWLHGQITARRDTVRHPFLKPATPARIVFHGSRSVNSIPATSPENEDEIGVASVALGDKIDATWSITVMTNTLMAALCGAALLASGCSTLHKSDSATLQGTWKGHEMGRLTEGECCLMISGNSLEFRGADTNEWYKGTFTLREDKNPRQLVGAIGECPAPKYVGKTVYGIYRLEAGTLTLTGNEPGNPEVPSSFDAPGSRKFVLKKP